MFGNVKKPMTKSATKNLMLSGAMAAFLMGLPVAAQATSINLAVAANFYGTTYGAGTSPLYDIIQKFQTAHPGYTVNVPQHGATTTLQAQITGGNTSQVDLFLAADMASPLAMQNTYATMVSGPAAAYGLGYAVFFSNTTAYNVSCGGSGTCGFTTSPGYTSIAIADPTLAPYGKAAQEILWNQFGIDVNNPPSGVTIHKYSSITNAFNAVVSHTDPVGFANLSALCYGGSYPTSAAGTNATAVGYNFDDVFNSPLTHYSRPVVMGLIEITYNTSRTTDQENEVQWLKTYLTDFTPQVSSTTTDSPAYANLKQYCYNAPNDYD